MMELVEMARNANGYVSSAQATAAGVPRRLLTAAVACGEPVQVDRGLYALPDTWEDPLFIAQHHYRTHLRHRQQRRRGVPLHRVHRRHRHRGACPHAHHPRKRVRHRHRE